MVNIKAKQMAKPLTRKSAFVQNWDLYLIAIIGLLYLVVFKYLPMGGIAIAFQDFNLFDGISGSPWVGLENFKRLFGSADFYKVFRNTLLISVYKLVFLFPLPIILALMLNEIRNMAFKKITQSVIYIPHFLSWVVVAGIFTTLLSPSTGIINNVLAAMGFERISFFTSNTWFRSVLVATAGWKESGWSAIIFIAAIAGVDQELYEAAYMDGAGRFKQMLHITLPGISSTIVLMLILKLGQILDVGTEQVLMMYNPTVYDTGDVISSYVYRMGLGKMEYSFSTAVGLFNSVIGLILVVSGNYLSKKFTGSSIW